MRKLIIILLILISAMTVTVCFAAPGVSEEEQFLSFTSLLELQKKELPSEFKLPESIEIIENEAFEGTAITTIELPEKTTIIADRAFADISTLRVVRIPITTTSIASTAFAGSNHVSIHAAPNSYARKFARINEIPFSPLATFCATNQGVESITVINVLDETVETDSSGIQKPEKQWLRYGEIKVVGTLDIIIYEIQSRGPPMEKC